MQETFVILATERRTVSVGETQANVEYIFVVNILFFEKNAILFVKFAWCSNKKSLPLRETNFNKNRSRFVSKVFQ